jgi:hypothetical protein
MIISKIVVSAYLVPDKCQYLRIGCTDFRSKTSFRNVIKFYGAAFKDVNKIWPRNIYQKKPWSWQTLKKTNFRKFWEGKKLAGFQKPLFGSPRTIPHPSPVSLFCGNFIKLKIASREPCIPRKYYLLKSLFCKNRTYSGLFDL